MDFSVFTINNKSGKLNRKLVLEAKRQKINRKIKNSEENSEID